MLLLIGCDNSSLVIDRLCDEAINGDPTVACFYFDFASRNEQSPVNMLGSLLRQVVSGQREIPEAIVQDFRKEKMSIGGRRLQVSGVLKMFQTIAATRSTFICVDALDECVPENRVVVLEALGLIVQGSPSTRIFMTGRPQVRCEVEREFCGAATFVFIRATEDGVLTFLREKLRRDAIPNMMNSTLEGEIMKSIPAISSETYVERVQGQSYPKPMADIFGPRFLLASLHIEVILRGTTVARRRKTLKAIKNGAELGDAYGATLERIKAQDEEKATLAIAALTWVCHSERPLQVEELCHALAVEIGEKDFDPENVPSIETLLACCQGLIIVDAEASTVRLIHYTVQECLCNYPGLFSGPHSILAETCLTYLNSHQVKNLTSHSLQDCGSMPFLEYSASYWGTHAKRELSDNAKTLALELLNQYEGHISAAALLGQVLHPDYRGLITPSPLFSGLHCASFFGIVDLMTVFLNAEGCEVDQQDCVGRTPLAWAAGNGHEGAVKILLDQRDVDPNRPDKHKMTPLGTAAAEGHEGVVRLLLERENVDPNHLDIYSRTPVGWAAAKGHDAVVKILLEQEEIDLDHPDKDGNRPLGCAAICGKEEVVKILLERQDVDPNRPSNNDRTPLGCAAIEGHEGVVRLLLQRENVDPNRPDMYGETPLGGAAAKGYEAVVKILLEREEIDLDHPNKDGNRPLGCAAICGKEKVVKILLERQDVDPNRPNNNDRTPLGCAAIEGHEGVVRLLLQRENVDPNHPDKDGNGPLGCAAISGKGEVVKILLERQDVDPNRPNNDDQTPLCCAVIEGHEGVVRLLLQRENVDPNHPDKDGDGSLGCAAICGQEGVVKILLERQDVDLNRPNNNDRTPLAHAAINGHEGVVKLLLERENTDPNYPDENDRTPLGYAAMEGHEAVVKLLLGYENVDPSHPDKYDRTPLDWATINGHEIVVGLLLKRGDVDPNRSDKYSLTPLSYPASEGRGLVQLLQARKSAEPPDAGATREGQWDAWKCLAPFLGKKHT